MNGQGSVVGPSPALPSVLAGFDSTTGTHYRNASFTSGGLACCVTALVFHDSSFSVELSILSVCFLDFTESSVFCCNSVSFLKTVV